MAVVPDAVSDRATAAGRALAEAEAANTSAWAEWGRHLLLHLADEHGIAEFSFETEAVYNDEGGYFDTVNITAVDAAGNDVDCDLDEFYEVSLTPEIVVLYTDGSVDGSVAVAHLRGVTF